MQFSRHFSLEMKGTVEGSGSRFVADERKTALGSP
jgi:hypothetical protein